MNPDRLHRDRFARCWCWELLQGYFLHRYQAEIARKTNRIKQRIF